jgi:hypothetical protein
VHWHQTLHYYGGGESFVFTFHDEDDIKVYRWTEKDERFQFSDERCVAVGGGKK